MPQEHVVTTIQKVMSGEPREIVTHHDVVETGGQTAETVYKRAVNRCIHAWDRQYGAQTGVNAKAPGDFVTLFYARTLQQPEDTDSIV